jgi:hypothetical protein
MEDLENKLVEYGLVTNEQFYHARQESYRTGKSIWAILVKLGYLAEEDIILFFAKESDIPYIKISDYKIKQETLDLIDENFCIQNLVIPLFKVQNVLFVACSNPLNASLMEALAKMTGCIIEPLLATAHSILGALDLYWRMEDKIFEVGKFIIKQSPVQGFSLWREAERMPFKTPVSIKIVDESVVVRSTVAIEGNTNDISKNGAAVGLQIPLFLPQGLKISLNFNPTKNSTIPALEAKGEIVQCHMEKEVHYFLGVKFIEIKEEVRSALLKLASG